jgi:glycosyltransferase involved in cell wall biosynthesis
LASLSGYDVVVVRDMPSIAALGWLACRLRGRAFVYWMSFPIVDSYRMLADLGPRKIGWLRWLYARLREHAGGFLLRRVVLPGANHVFVQSAAMLEDVLTKGCSSERTTPVPMGVDVELMSAELVEAAADPRLIGRETLIYCGTFSASRRLDIVIEGFALAWRERPTIILVMVGREEINGEIAALQAGAERLGVAEHVVWAGWLPLATVAGLVRAARIGLSLIPRGPLFDVSSPTKLCEYLALGVPGLVNDIPDQALVARRSQAARVVAMEPAAIAGGILAMLRNPEDLAAMSARGPAYVRSERSYGVIAGQVANVLVACAQSSPRKSLCP